jgi:hypothetical protein
MAAFGHSVAGTTKKSREDIAMKSLASATLLAFALSPSYGFAEESTGHNMSDEELIKLSLSAAPEAVTKDATVVAMGHDGTMRTLRQGTGQWMHARSRRSGQPGPDVRR